MMNIQWDDSVKMNSSEYMTSVRQFKVPRGSAALWHLGQNSYLLKSPEGTVTAIDPYLTDYCGSARTGEPGPNSRVLPVHIEPEDLDADLILITHGHDDHADPYTLERLATCGETARFMAPWQACRVIESSGIDPKQIELIHPKETRAFNDLTVTGTFCLPTDGSDLNHLGFLVQFKGGKTYYNTGDTAFVPLLGYLADTSIDLMAVCVNGGYMNLSHFDAARVTAMIEPKKVIPSHYDVMPHNWQPPEVFRHSLKVAGAKAELIIPAYFEPLLF